MNMTPEIKVELENGRPVTVERTPDGGARFSVPANAGYRVIVTGSGAASRMAVAALMAQALAAQAQPIDLDRVQPRDGRCADWKRDRFGQVKRR
jgi:hypothetical protein